MELLCVFAKGENPLDIDFERAKELIDEKALLMHLSFIKERCSESVGRFGP
jgi:DNA topoisomerase-1